MKKEPQIFTSTQAQNVPVPQDILKGLEQGSMEAIAERWRKFEAKTIQESSQFDAMCTAADSFIADHPNALTGKTPPPPEPQPDSGPTPKEQLGELV